MKRLIILIILIMGILNCTARDIELWNEVERERRERGYACYVDPYYGTRKCGYLK